MWLRRIIGGLLVVSVVEESAAWKAGIVPGDRIYLIDETEIGDTAGLEGLALLEGWVGSELEMVVGSEHRSPTRLALVRERIVPPAFAVSEPEEGTLHIKMRQITDESVAEFDELLIQRNGSYSKLILDLRNNPGGSAEAARKMIKIFYAGRAWVEVDRAGERVYALTHEIAEEDSDRQLTPFPLTPVQESP